MAKLERIFLFLLFTSIVFYCCVAESEDETPPNIVLIISDDQAWSDYSFMGHPHISTPHLDALAKNSLCFTRGYASAPLCSPSLATIMTGLYAYQHGITGNDPLFVSDANKYSEDWLTERKRHYLPLQEKFYENKLLTEYLREGGYTSFQTGKWWLGSWRDAHFDDGMTHGDPSRGGRHGDEGLKIGRDGLHPIFNFIEKAQTDKKPFFVWHAPFLPHTPHNPPKEILAKYLDKTESETEAKYWAMCEWFDQTCGDLLRYLRENGLEEKTIIIYTTDNGWIQRKDRNGYAPRSKRSPYEGGIRTPLMIKWPGEIGTKVDSTTLVSNIDIVPTILGILGIENRLPGTNLLQVAERDHRKTIFAEAFDHDILDPSEPTRSLQYRIALEYPWKLILPDTTNVPDARVELFNTVSDPSELINQSGDKPEVVLDLQGKIDAWWTPEHLKSN